MMSSTRFYATNFELIDPTAGLVITTHEGVKDLTRTLRAQSPDLSVNIEEEIAEGDVVVHRWTARGLNPRTGEIQQTPGISIYHLREGRIVSEFVIPDGRPPSPKSTLIAAPSGTKNGSSCAGGVAGPAGDVQIF